jgi:hypothetical protein
MQALIILATIMALFGGGGYLGGAKSTIFTTVIIWLGLLVVNRADEIVTRMINGLNFGVRFVLAGGLNALGGSGDRGAALDEIFARLENVEPLINPDGSGPGMLLIFLGLTLAGFLLGMLKLFKGRSSFLGLVLGLANGYILSGFLLRQLLPEASGWLPLPQWLFGGGAESAAPAPAGPNLGSSLAAKITAALNALAESGQIALIIAIAIAIFVLLATRLGNRSVKKG